MQFNIIYIMRN